MINFFLQTFFPFYPLYIDYQRTSNRKKGEPPYIRVKRQLQFRVGSTRSSYELKTASCGTFYYELISYRKLNPH